MTIATNDKIDKRIKKEEWNPYPKGEYSQKECVDIYRKAMESLSSPAVQAFIEMRYGGKNV